MDDVVVNFGLLSEAAPAALQPLLEYFDVTYVNGVRAVGRGRGVESHYPPRQLNHYQTTLKNEHRTNNISEG